MTLIIGMYYDSGNGAILVADSRAMRAGDYTQDQKLYEVGDDVVFAAAGYVGMVEKLLPKVEQTRFRTRRVFASEIVDIFEDEMAKLNERYKMSRPYRFSANDTLLNAIVGFMDDNKPKLYTLYDFGFAEIIRDFHAVGHGARHARNILRTLYNPSVSKDRALEIGVHVLVEVSQVDAMVDAHPQIAILEKGTKNQAIDIINKSADGEFQIVSNEIEKIKKKVKGIEEKRTKVFHLLLDGSKKLMDKLDVILKEYENDGARQEGTGKTREGETATGEGGQGQKSS